MRKEDILMFLKTIYSLIYCRVVFSRGLSLAELLLLDTFSPSFIVVSAP